MQLSREFVTFNCSILEFSDAVVTKIILFGDNTLSDSSNTLILNSTIDYINLLIDLMTPFQLPDNKQKALCGTSISFSDSSIFETT